MLCAPVQIYNRASGGREIAGRWAEPRRIGFSENAPHVAARAPWLACPLPSRDAKHDDMKAHRRIVTGVGEANMHVGRADASN